MWVCRSMIIDCHGHYTTAPKALEVWRVRHPFAVAPSNALAPLCQMHLMAFRLSDRLLRTLFFGIRDFELQAAEFRSPERD